MQGKDHDTLIGQASAIEVGDIIANFGVVTGWTDDGVFRIFTIRGDICNLDTGQIELVEKQWVRHIATDVVISKTGTWAENLPRFKP